MHALANKHEAQQILTQLHDGPLPAECAHQDHLADVRRALLSHGYTIRRIAGDAPHFVVESLQGPQHRVTRKRSKARRRTLPAIVLGSVASAETNGGHNNRELHGSGVRA